MSGSGLWTVLRERKNTSPIIALFVRDGAICFGMVFGAFIQNCGLFVCCALGTDSSSMSVLCSRPSVEYHFHNCGRPLNQMGTAYVFKSLSIACS